MTPSLLLLITGLLLVLSWRYWPTPWARAFQALDRRHGRMRPRRIASRDIEWQMLEGGHGETLVLLHGFNGDADHFNRVARRLTGHFRILAPDLPGFGETSTTRPVDFRIEHQARTVIDWMDRIGVQHCFLGGSSMGGYIACQIAALQPERIRALWLLAPGGVKSAPLSPLLQEVAEEGHNPLVIRSLEDFRRLVDFCFVHPPWIPAPLARYLTARAAARADEHQRGFDEIRHDSAPAESIVAGSKVPALIVWGRSDQVLHPAGASILAKAFADAQCLMLPDTGHLPMIENPAVVAEAWIGYCEKLARRETGADSG
ncbi:MAG: alpha/beta fold hydrolase [Wenzhouxiangellaceae bacterium]